MKITRRQLRRILIKEVRLLNEMPAPSGKCIDGIVHEEIVRDYYLDVNSLLAAMAEKTGKSIDYYQGMYELASSQQPRQMGGTPAAALDMMGMAKKLGMTSDEINLASYPEWHALMIKNPTGFMPTDRKC
tara:strand:+ start:824 stop:1213 length:390 start_codon:yes stop_codon:yes gene_type:complete